MDYLPHSCEVVLRQKWDVDYLRDDRLKREKEWDGVTGCMLLEMGMSGMVGSGERKGKEEEKTAPFY